MATTVKSGWLQKQGGVIWKRWKNSYCVVNHVVLKINNGPQSTTAKFTVNLKTDCIKIAVGSGCGTIQLPTKTSKVEALFAVVTKSKKHILYAASREECREWVEVLENAKTAVRENVDETAPKPNPIMQPVAVPSPYTTMQPVAVPSPYPTMRPMAVPSPYPTMQPMAAPPPYRTMQPMAVPYSYNTMQPMGGPPPYTTMQRVPVSSSKTDDVKTSVETSVDDTAPKPYTTMQPVPVIVGGVVPSAQQMYTPPPPPPGYVQPIYPAQPVYGQAVCGPPVVIQRLNNDVKGTSLLDLLCTTSSNSSKSHRSHHNRYNMHNRHNKHNMHNRHRRKKR